MSDDITRSNLLTAALVGALMPADVPERQVVGQRVPLPSFSYVPGETGTRAAAMSQAVWGWSWVIAGTILVGVGGCLVTLGWDRIRMHHQRQNAIVGVVREVELNDRMIEAAMALARRWPTRSEGENFSHESYHSTHTTAMVTSGQLDRAVPTDRDVLDALEAYQHAISRFNAGLRIVGRLNPGIFLKKDLIQTTDAKGWPENSEEALAETFRHLVTAHRTAKRLLEQLHPRAARGANSTRLRTWRAV